MIEINEEVRLSLSSSIIGQTNEPIEYLHEDFDEKFFIDRTFEIEWEQCIQLLKQWKMKMIEKIDEIYQKNLNEIQRYKNEMEKCHRTPLVFNVRKYFRNATILPEEIRRFEVNVNQFKKILLDRPKPLHMRIDVPSLDNCISMEIDSLRNLSLTNYVTFRKEFFSTSSIRFLVSSKSKLIFINENDAIQLYDHSLTPLGEFSWKTFTNESLKDICYSSNDEIVVFLTEHSIWSFDEKNSFSLIAQIRTERRSLSNLTFLNSNLFLSYDRGKFIERWSTESDWHLEKRWKFFSTSIDSTTRDDDDLLYSLHSNSSELVLYSKKSLQICSKDLIRLRSIEFVENHPQQTFSSFVYLSFFHSWMFFDRIERCWMYFHKNYFDIRKFSDENFRHLIPIDSSNNFVLIRENFVEFLSMHF